MYAAELPVPDKLDGCVVKELFTDEFAAIHPLEFGSEPLLSAEDGSSLSPEEEKMVEEKLRGLGYI
jgi:hypothetical protein